MITHSFLLCSISAACCSFCNYRRLHLFIAFRSFFLLFYPIFCRLNRYSNFLYLIL